jgi:cytochrome c oxidase subunit 3
VIRLKTTITLGILFTALQALEYIEAPFDISDSTYGTTFFIATGFHGLHVIIGTSFLSVTLIQTKTLTNNKRHIVGFECAA